MENNNNATSNFKTSIDGIKNFKGFSSHQYFIGLTSLSVLFLVLLNIYALRPIGIKGIALNEAGIIFIAPVMVIQNIMGSVWGYKTAFKVSAFALACQIFITILTVGILALPVDDSRADFAENFAAVFSSHWRIVLASILAFIISSFCNIYFFEKINSALKNRLRSKGFIFFLAAVISTCAAQVFDDGTFNVLAYAPIGMTEYEMEWPVVFMTMLTGGLIQIGLEAVIDGAFSAQFVVRLQNKIAKEKAQEIADINKDRELAMSRILDEFKSSPNISNQNREAVMNKILAEMENENTILNSQFSIHN